LSVLQALLVFFSLYYHHIFNRFFLLTMKTAILFALPLAVSAAVITTNAVAPLVGVDKLTPVLKKNAQRTLTKFGRQLLH
jgi:UDP-N-acetylmuramyl pentapeptide phosphotransferase/UDP-N-acetylglucosamine-1-phosphate transferase